jgi:membrane-associated progesterone receptor component
VVYVRSADADTDAERCVFPEPGAGYNVFAGREAARALAKMSLREEDCTDEGLEELSKREQETLRDWEERLLYKYSVVGQASGACVVCGVAESYHTSQCSC